jgi:hypothetical protein
MPLPPLLLLLLLHVVQCDLVKTAEASDPVPVVCVCIGGELNHGR